MTAPAGPQLQELPLGGSPWIPRKDPGMRLEMGITHACYSSTCSPAKMFLLLPPTCSQTNPLIVLMQTFFLCAGDFEGFIPRERKKRAGKIHCKEVKMF